MASIFRHPGDIVRPQVVGTEQQEQLWGELSTGDREVLVEARAGTGKSFSCREGMRRIASTRPGQRIRYAVFNKANADEFRSNCPRGVEAGTCHSFGLASLRNAFQPVIEKNKSYLLLDETEQGKRLPRWLRRAAAMLAGHAKGAGLSATPSRDELLALMLHYDINGYNREEEVIGWARKLVSRAAERTDLVDFDDMLWLPLIHDTPFPEIDVLFIDECQDWSHVQHRLIPGLAGAGRIVAVGDRYQAIYAFRGADPQSIPRLEKLLAESESGLAQLPLTVTFRCPQSHIALARELVHDIEAHPKNGDGIVETGFSLDRLAGQVQPGELVICPTNAPVVKAALACLAECKPAKVRGRALGDQLLAIVRQVGDVATMAAMAAGVQRWLGKELLRMSDREGVEDVIESLVDRAAGLQAVMESCESPGEVEFAVDRLFSDVDDSRSVMFSTVHRAKGSEASTVYLIDIAGRPPRQEWEAEQQRNLRYVALTRSKHRLVFVDPPECGRKAEA
jgi:ATP-dependent DNA helicase UvrD/PcrA